MGCTPSMILDHKKGHRDSTGSQDQVLGGKSGGNGNGGSGVGGGLGGRVEVPRSAPRASMDSDGFSIHLPGKKDSYVSQMGNNITTSLHIKRISGSSGGSPGARLGHRKSSLALTPEDEPLDITDEIQSPSQLPSSESCPLPNFAGYQALPLGCSSPRAKSLPTSVSISQSDPVPHTNRNAAGGGAMGGITVAQQDPLRVLCAMFPDRDRVCDALMEGCSRLGLEASTVRAEDALEACTSRRPSIVVLDSRSARLDAENLCRAVRNLKHSQFTVIVAVVKKSHYVKEDFSILPFLDAGFNRVCVESSSANAWSREAAQLSRGLAKPLAQAGAARALLAALHRCRDVVHVTDDHCRVQYMNRAGERLLGWTTANSSPSTVDASPEAVGLLSRGREWEGALPTRRRSPSDTIHLPCKAAPVSCDGRSTTHYVFVSELPSSNANTSSAPASGIAWDAPRGSLHSVRRGSLDIRSIGSDGLRRASLAKLQGLPLEAPITRVISLLSSAQEGATPQTVALLDCAMDVLRTTELYSPQVRDDHRLRTDDPVANDLIGALLSQGPTNVLSSRRSSNDSTVVRSQASRPNIKHKAPAQIRDLLDTSLSWDFDIFKLEELTKRRPLVHLGFNLMCHFDACSVLECEERTMFNWLTVIEMNYHVSNTYHNSTHAADVMQAVACYLRRPQLQNLLEPLDSATALIAAAAHDVDHPGTSSAFLCNSRHPLAVLYNDLAVLESHHAALTFKLTLNDDRVNIFKNLDRDTYKVARHNVIDMILATEMTKHFEHLAKFVNVFSTKPNNGSKEDGIGIDDGPTLDMTLLTLPENVLLVKRMMIKCADVSNPSRSARYCIEWARRIAEEYFLQTDEEKARELPVVMPVFDRASCSIPRSQIGFIDFIIIDMIEAWNVIIDMPDLVTHTRSNYQLWRDMDDQEVTTLQDITKMQANLVMPPLNIQKNSPD